MQETKITKERIKHHFTYSWWKYALFIVLAAVGWNLIYTSTAYSPPREKRLDVYFVTYAVPEEELRWFEEEAMARYPDVEESRMSSVVYTDSDSYYGSIQLTTYMGAGEGDIMLMPRERFDTFAVSEGFVALDDAIASGALNLRGIDVSRGTVTTDEGTRGVYGIPADSLYGLMDHAIDNRDLMVCVMAYSPNEERAIDWIDWLIETMQAPKPEWLEEQEAQSPAADNAVSDMPSY